jgi:hypothetical protein
MSGEDVRTDRNSLCEFYMYLFWKIASFWSIPDTNLPDVKIPYLYFLQLQESSSP